MPFALQKQSGLLGQDQASQAAVPSAQPKVLLCPRVFSGDIPGV